MSTKKRHYYYIEGKDPANPSKLKYIRRDIECDDTFDGELVMLAFRIGLMHEISSVLSEFKLRNDAGFFFSECREVVSVPEKHVNEKGEGSITFQSYFHKFPDSVQYFFDDATVVIMLHPQDHVDSNGNRDYNMIGYIHANHIDFKDTSGKLHNGYYYNVLRLSERTVNGKPIYRRKRIFTTMFSILLDITVLEDMHFVYASMGRENQAINDALKMNSARHGKLFETFPMLNNSHPSLFLGRSGEVKKLVDISDNKQKLHEYYQMIDATRKDTVFNQLHSEENFNKMIERILKSSPTSRIYMIPDEKGNILAAGVFMNWGDYMHVKLQNPTGILTIIDSLKITDKLLVPFLLVGPVDTVKKMIRGAAYKYRKEHKVHITVLNGTPGDPYYDTKKGLIKDNYNYFVIYDRPEEFEAMKAKSKDAQGNVRLFVDMPML
jgi:hypothetical protein